MPSQDNVQSCICICAGWILGGAGPHTNIIIIAVLCYTCSVLCLLEQPRVYKTRAGPLKHGAQLYMCVRGIAFACLYGFQILFWKRSDGVVFICFSF